MGSRVLQIFECDRCHDTDEGPDNYWPKDWTIIRLGSATSSYVLCKDCAIGFRSWWWQFAPAKNLGGG